MHKQADFVTAIFKDSQLIPEGVECIGNDRIERRFSVYRNNVIAGLIEAMRDGFPITKAVVGEDFFQQMARDFVRQNPPDSPVLLTYGDDFDTFIEQYDAAASVAYLADIARIEIKKRRVYFAANDAPLSKEQLVILASEDGLSCRLSLVRAYETLSSSFPIYDIWQRLTENPNHTIGIEPQDILIDRINGDVRILRLPTKASTFFNALSIGATLEEAAERLVEKNNEAPIDEMVANAIRLTATIIQPKPQ